jgi:hypothetical protein
VRAACLARAHAEPGQARGHRDDSGDALVGPLLRRRVCLTTRRSCSAAQLYDNAAGVEVRAWIGAGDASVSGSRSHGWTLHTLVDEAMADADGAVVHCRKGHHGLHITVGLCREAVRIYRQRGRKVRRPAVVAAPGS